MKHKAASELHENRCEGENKGWEQDTKKGQDGASRDFKYWWRYGREVVTLTKTNVGTAEISYRSDKSGKASASICSSKPTKNKTQQTETKEKQWKSV